MCGRQVTIAGLPEGVQPLAAAAGEHVSACTTSDGSAYFWGMASTGVLPKGPIPDDADEHDDDVLPRKMNRTKALGWRRVVQWSFGGQHGMFLGLPPPQGAAPPESKGA